MGLSMTTTTTITTCLLLFTFILLSLCQISVSDPSVFCFGLSKDADGVCNGQGTCVSTDTCQCVSTYTGSNCTIPVCFGYNATDVNVCSRHGNCTDGDTCECEDGFTGSACAFPICYGTNSTDDKACSGNGNCTEPDTCTCDTHYVGRECQVPVCFGLNSTNIQVCSGNGNCTDGDLCTCESGYTGPDCSIPICFGRNATDPGVCSGHGNCTGINNCTCLTGYVDNDCSIPVCYGRNASDSEVCFGRGNCTDHDTCDCPTSVVGTECELNVCFGRNETNPLVCSGHGNCSIPEECTCTSNYTGYNCSIPICYGWPANVSNVCSGRGKCHQPNNCTCNSKIVGDNCQTFTCYGIEDYNTTVCSGFGNCTGVDKCSCNKGHNGTRCDIFACSGVRSNRNTTCSSRGTCVAHNQCVCNQGYVGDNCQYLTCLSTNTSMADQCSGHGKCNTPDVCTCNYGYQDAECEMHTCYGIRADNTSFVCSNNGNCTKLDTCVCDPGWTGYNCSIPICFNKTAEQKSVCSFQGKCVAPDTCVCLTEFIFGAKCEDSYCPNQGHCHLHGLCVGIETCGCYWGWNMPDCSTYHCKDRGDCRGSGDCVGPNTCRCYDGYGSVDCIPLCYGKTQTSQSVCSGHGSCIAPNYCSCQTGYRFKDCSIPVCYGVMANEKDVCSTHGYCRSPDRCECYTGYSGWQCQIPHCYGINSTLPSVCSKRGTCVSHNNCDCNKSYTGSTCQHAVCNKKSAADNAVCSSRGKCVSPNNCTCNAGYQGSDCEITYCFEVRSDSTAVCSGHGSCIAGDTCSCNAGWTSADCSVPTCDAFAATSAKVCSGHGECITAETCVCEPNYVGNYCQYPTCFETSAADPNVCSDNGICTEPNTCKCYTGYDGDNCEGVQQGVDVCFRYAATDPRVCSKHGTCINNNNCECESGYTGSKCQLTACQGLAADNSTVCSGNGKCIAPNQCSCNQGYSGAKCDTWNCYGISNKLNSCNGGTCVSPDTCICTKQGYIDDCTVTVCGGIKSNDPNVCSGRGTCSKPNKCSCKNGYYGPNCEHSVCYGLIDTDTLVCSGNGQCDDANNCTCDPGYLGDKCEIPTCAGIRSDSASVCNGHGTCTSLNNCECFESDRYGYFEGTTCSKCLPNYRSYPNCKIKTCDAESTCTGHGVCNGLNCVCSDNDEDGHFEKPFCRTCKSGYIGLDCKTVCNASEVCNGHGTCDSIGRCNCYNSASLGYFSGKACDTCQTNVYGYDVCKTMIPGVFAFSDSGNQADGSWATPVKKMKCSDFIHPDDLPSLGAGAICTYTGPKNRFSLIWGSNATVVPGDTLRFNVEFTNREAEPVYVSVTLLGPLNPSIPVAAATAPDQISVCDGIDVDGSNSYSSDGRPLIYYWTAISGSNLPYLNAYLQTQTDMIVQIPDERLKSGSTYVIQLVVENFIGGVSDPVSVTFTKLSYAIALAEVYGPKSRVFYRNEFNRIDGIGIIGKCFYNDRTLVYRWRQLSGKSLSPREVSAGLLFDVGTLPPYESTYKFELTVYPAANPIATTTSTVTVFVQFRELIAKIAGGDRTVRRDEDFILDASVSVDQDTSPEDASFEWSCLNAKTNGLCATSITDVLSATTSPVVIFESLRADQRIPAGKYIFSVEFQKGHRTATTSVTIEVLGSDAPTVTLTSSHLTSIPANEILFIDARIVGDYTSYRWTIDDEIVYPSDFVVANDKRLILPKNYLDVGEHTIYLYAVNNAVISYSKLTFTVNRAPQPGIITITPASGTELTEFTFIASQWSDADVPLYYQWSLYHPNDDSPITVTSKDLSNKFYFSTVSAGLAENNYIIEAELTVTDTLGASTTLRKELHVTPAVYATEKEKMDALAALANRLEEMSTFAHNNRAFVLVDSLTKRMLGRSRAMTDSRTDLIHELVTKIDQMHRDIDPLNPLDTSYYLQIGNTISTLSKAGPDEDDQTTLLSLIDVLLQTAKKPLHPVHFDKHVAKLYVDAIGKLEQIGDHSEVSLGLIRDILVLMGPSSEGIIQTVSESGVSLAVARYLRSEVSDLVLTLPQITDSVFTGSVVVHLSDGLRQLLDLFNIESAQIQSTAFDPAVLNPAPYTDASARSLQSSAVVLVEVRKPDGTIAIVNSINDPIRLKITVPVRLDLSVLRDINNKYSEGFYPTCRYYSDSQRKWVADSTCRVTNIAATSVICECTHLTMFIVTYDEYDVPLPPSPPKPTPKPAPSHAPPPSTDEDDTDDDRRLGLGLGLGLGFGIPLLVILAVILLIFFMVLYICIKNKFTEEPKENDLDLFKDQAIDVEMRDVSQGWE